MDAEILKIVGQVAGIGSVRRASLGYASKQMKNALVAAPKTPARAPKHSLNYCAPKTLPMI